MVIAIALITLIILPSDHDLKEFSSSASVDRPEVTLEIGRPENAERMLANFPASIIRYEAVSDSRHRAFDSESPVRIYQRLDHEGYDQLAISLGQQLTPVSLKSGTATLGLTNFAIGTPLIVRYDLSSPILSEVIFEAIETQKTSIVLVGRKLIRSTWNLSERHPSQRMTSGSQIVSLDWYSLDDVEAEELRLAFRRVRTLAIEPVKTAHGVKQSLPWIFPYQSPADHIRQGTILSPGGPAGVIYSAGTAEGDLNLTEARQRFEKSLERNGIDQPILGSERVLLLLPGFFVNGQFSDEADIGTVDSAGNGKVELRIHEPGG